MKIIDSSQRGASYLLLIILLGFRAFVSEAQCADAFTNTGQLAEGRNSHTATVLANGNVLIAGGNKAGNNSPVSSAEIYDPITRISTPTGSLAAPRVGHCAVLLPDGKVLVAGGIATAELYDPATGTWQDASPVEDPFVANSCTLLATGKVLIVGGTDANTQTAKAKLYDPLSNSWLATGSLATVQGGRSAVLLSDGRVLVAGGYDPATNRAIAASDVYDPATGGWTSTGPLGTARNSPNLQRLTNGKVIAIGGSSETTITVEQFDPSTGSWTATGSLTKTRLGFSAVPLADNTVLVSGGFQNTNPLTTILASSEVYNPATGIWKRVDSMNSLRCLHQTTVLHDGSVLITGGWGYNNPAVFGDFNHGVKPVETYSPVVGHWRNIGPLNNKRYNHAAIRLADGKILVTGGTGEVTKDPVHPLGPLDIAELYNPAVGLWAETANTAPKSGNTLLLGDQRVFSFNGYSATLYDPGTGIWTPAGSIPGPTIATLLKIGKVLVTGSSDGKAYLFDPTTDTWSEIGSTGGPKGSHVTAVLPDGKVLVVGGYASQICAVYNPLSGTWSATGSTIAYRHSATVTTLSNGKVLLCGGLGDRNFPLLTTELYDPSTGIWSAGSPMNKNRRSPLAIPLGDGRLLVTGGTTEETANCAEIYNPSSNFWTPTAPLGTARIQFSGTPLANGQVLVTGGQLQGAILATSEIYDPGSPAMVLEQTVGTLLPWGQTSNFGAVVAGGSYSRTFSILNVGSGNLAGLTASLSGPDAADFSISTAPSASAIAFGEATSLGVRFGPVSTGVKNATLHISGSGIGGIPFSIDLTGAATAPNLPEIVIEQLGGDSLVSGQATQFGRPALGTHADLQFTIRNVGTIDLTGLALTLDGKDAADFSVSELLSSSGIIPGAAVAFTVRFSPAALGSRIATLHVASSDSDENPFVIHLTGSAVTPVPKIAIEQPVGVGLAIGTATRDFGMIETGGISSLQFTISNTGTADLSGVVASVDGAASSGFKITGSPPPDVLASGESTQISVTFSPVSAGIKSAILRIASNDVEGNPFDIHLTGTAYFPAPEIAVEQPANTRLVDGIARKSFGTVKVGKHGPARIFTIRNTGTASLTRLAVVKDGRDTSDFTVGALGKSTLAPGASTTFKVTFKPTSAGTRGATIRIKSNDADENPFDIKLTGVGANR